MKKKINVLVMACLVVFQAACEPTGQDFVYKPEDLNTVWAQNAAQITLNGTTARISGSGAVVSGNTVTIQKAGDYVLSGVWNDGQIVVDANKNALVRLVLNGVRLSSFTGSPLYLKQAKKTVLILPDGTQNYITDAVSYQFPKGADEPSAAVFAKDNLSITGPGAFTVNGRFRDAIVSRDTLTITGGTITVSAVNDGLVGHDALAIRDGIFSIEAGNDGIKSNKSTDPKAGFVVLSGGTYALKTGMDAVQAETSLSISGGTYSVLTGGGASGSQTSKSKKAFKAGTMLAVEGGTFSVDACDDAFHSNADLYIRNGTFTIKTGGDAFHADTSLRIDNGQIVVDTCSEGIEGATVDITGGTITISSSDDAINASGGAGPYVRISGGTIDVLSIGDSIDANGDVYMDDGLVRLSGPSMGMQGAIDFDGSFVISGGRLITAGSSLAPAAQSTQASLLISYTSQLAAGSLIVLADSTGRELLTYTSRTSCSASAFTSPDLTIGQTYTVLIDGKKRAVIRLDSMLTMIGENGTAYSIGRGRRGGGRW
ncbi:carbohydrate-binding domain-containing protein [Breznakiellaceae bacterium SP9]